MRAVGLALHLLACAVGGIWLISSFVGTSTKHLAGQLRAAGLDPRTARPALWVQRAMGALLLAWGLWGLLGRHG